MAAARTICRRLRNAQRYVAKFPRQESLQYELLTAEAFSHILNLPFCTADDNGAADLYCVKWHGTLAPLRLAPGGGPDATVRAYDFHILVEATMRTGANQWIREFAPAVEHGNEFAGSEGIRAEEVFVILVCPTVGRYTHTTISNRGDIRPALIPLEDSVVAEILDTCILGLTVQHADVRGLLERLWRHVVRGSADVNRYTDSVRGEVRNWQAEILRSDKLLFVGLKAYQAMKKGMGETNRAYFSVSELWQRLARHATIRHYYKLLGTTLHLRDIEDGLRGNKLAYEIGPRFHDALFTLVCKEDVAGRLRRFIKAMEAI